MKRRRKFFCCFTEQVVSFDGSVMKTKIQENTKTTVKKKKTVEEAKTNREK